MTTVVYGYKETTAIASITATLATTSQAVLTMDPITFADTTPVWIEVYAPWFGNSTNVTNMYWELWGDSGGGATGLQRFWDGREKAAGAQDMGGAFGFRWTPPSAGTWTLSWRAHVDAGTGLVECGAGGAGTDMPAFMRVTASTGENELIAPVTKTTASSVTATTEGTATTILTLGAFTLAAQTDVMFEFFVPWWGHSSTAATSRLCLFNGGTSVGFLCTMRAAIASAQLGGVTLKRQITLAAGTYTFSVRAFTSAGTLTLTGATGASGSVEFPMLLRATVATGGLLAESQQSYSETNANTDCIATSEAAATLINTASAITFDGATPCLIRMYFNSFGQSNASVSSRITLFDALNGGAAAPIGTMHVIQDWLAVNSSRGGAQLIARITPAAGSHQFSARGWVASASTYKLAGDTMPSNVRDMPFTLRVSTLVDPASLVVVPATSSGRRRRRSIIACL
jgi:hypothetical protein